MESIFSCSHPTRVWENVGFRKKYSPGPIGGTLKKKKKTKHEPPDQRNRWKQQTRSETSVAGRVELWCFFDDISTEDLFYVERLRLRDKPRKRYLLSLYPVPFMPLYYSLISLQQLVDSGAWGLCCSLNLFQNFDKGTFFLSTLAYNFGFVFRICSLLWNKFWKKPDFFFFIPRTR